MNNIIILGTGCAGLTAAIYAARANLDPLVIAGGQPGGQLTTTSEVENFPGFPKGIDGYELMERLREQAERFGARILNDTILSVKLEADLKKLYSETETYLSKTLVVATGASPRLLNIPGEKELYGGKGVTTCATCDGAFYKNMDVAVIGGGDSACEEALFLTRFCRKVYLIHRRDELRASSIMAERTLSNEKIFPIWNSVVEEILGVPEDAVSGIRLKNVQSGEEKSLGCKGVFIAIGHIPNTAFLKNSLKMDAQGYLLPEKGNSVTTQIPGVFIAGDCSDHVYRQAVTAAGLGCQAAIEAERWLSKQ